MNTMITRLLDSKNLGMILFSSNFNIIEVSDTAKTVLASPFYAMTGSNLLDILPEFIGNEPVIQDVLEGRIEVFRLDYVNRADTEGKTRYLNLLVLSGEDIGHGCIVLEDQSCWVTYNLELDPNQERTAKELAEFSSERDAETYLKLWESVKPGSDFNLAFMQELFGIPLLWNDPNKSPLEKWVFNYLAELFRHGIE